jgi:stage II sporulation protein AA (anti-sigma F factor antagonist)
MTPVSVSSGPDGVLEVALHGEIDYTNAARVNEAVRAAVGQAAPLVVRVDLGAVTFLDSSGIGVLVNALKTAQAADADFRVRRPSAKVLDQLRITGLTELFPIES